MCNACVERPPGLYVQDVLEPGHELYILDPTLIDLPFTRVSTWAPRLRHCLH